MSSLEQLVNDLQNPALRESALSKLVEERKVAQNLGPLIWNSFGTIAVLLEEIVSIYPFLSPPSLTHEQAVRVSNAVVILQSVASHQNTRMSFLQAKIHEYLYPFLNTDSSSNPFERIRLISLAVIGSLVKDQVNPQVDAEVVRLLVTSEPPGPVSFCLRAMDVGAELSKATAAFILWKIMSDGVGLNNVCEAPDRLLAVTEVLHRVVGQISPESDPRLSHHIIKCYLLLSEDQRGCGAIKTRLPPQFYDTAFINLCIKAEGTRLDLEILLHYLQAP